MKFLQDIITPESRQYLYRIIGSVLALLAVKGIIGQEDVLLIGGIAIAILGIAVADGNVSKTSETSESPRHRAEKNVDDTTAN